MNYKVQPFFLSLNPRSSKEIQEEDLQLQGGLTDVCLL